MPSCSVSYRFELFFFLDMVAVFACCRVCIYLTELFVLAALFLFVPLPSIAFLVWIINDVENTGPHSCRPVICSNFGRMKGGG